MISSAVVLVVTGLCYYLVPRSWYGGGTVDPGPVGSGAWAAVDSSFIPNRITATRGELLSALDSIQVRPSDGKIPGYARALFPMWDAATEDSGWPDDANPRCNARWQTLYDDSVTVAVFEQPGVTCVISGAMWRDPYGVADGVGGVYYLESDDPDQFDVDHVVPLSDAWNSGASEWSTAERERLANDPLNLVVTSASVNRSKGDSAADAYLPLNPAYLCTYAGTQILVKQRYQLTVTAPEQTALRNTVQDHCTDGGETR